MERMPLTCLTSLNSPTTVFSASVLCSLFMGADLPFATSATWATKPLSTYSDHITRTIFINTVTHIENQDIPTEKKRKERAAASRLLRRAYPKEVIGIVAPETDELENVIHRPWSNARKEPELDVPIVSLRADRTKAVATQFRTRKTAERPAESIEGKKCRGREQEPGKRHELIRGGVPAMRRAPKRRAPGRGKRRWRIRRCETSCLPLLARFGGRKLDSTESTIRSPGCVAGTDLI